MKKLTVFALLLSAGWFAVGCSNDAGTGSTGGTGTTPAANGTAAPAGGTAAPAGETK